MSKNIYEKMMHELMRKSSIAAVNEDVDDEVSIEDTNVDITTDAVDTDEIINAPADYALEQNEYIGRKLVDCKLCNIPFVLEGDSIEGVTCPSCMASEEDLIVCGEICPVGTLEKLSALDTKQPEEDITATEEEGEIVSSEESVNDEEVKDEDNEEVEESCKSSSKKQANFDESAMEKLVTKFLTENYSGVKEYKVTEASYKAGKLSIKGLLEFKTGKTTNIDFISTDLKLTEGVDSFKVKAKCEKFSKANAFIIECVYNDGNLCPKTLSYKFVTRSKGKPFSVYGKADLK